MVLNQCPPCFKRTLATRTREDTIRSKWVCHRTHSTPLMKDSLNLILSKIWSATLITETATSHKCWALWLQISTLRLLVSPSHQTCNLVLLFHFLTPDLLRATCVCLRPPLPRPHLQLTRKRSSLCQMLFKVKQMLWVITSIKFNRPNLKVAKSQRLSSSELDGADTTSVNTSTKMNSKSFWSLQGTTSFSHLFSLPLQLEH